MTVKLGQAKYSGDYVKRKYFRLTDGEASYRILPPLGNLAEEGRWSVFHSVHYGYRNSAGNMRVFISPLVKNRKTKMVEVPDAALERIQKLKAELEKAKTSGNKDLTNRLNELVGPKAQYNLDNNHYMNVIDKQGNIGVLKLRHRAKLALDATIKRLREEGVDPLSPENGRFFTFRRSGLGLDTTFQVEVLKEKLTVQNVGVVEREVVHTLTDEILGRLGKEAAQLDTLFKRPTSEEVARIVKESDLKTGKSRAVDEILDTKNDNSSEEEAYDDSAEYTEETASTSTTTAPVALRTTNTTSTHIASTPVAALVKTETSPALSTSSVTASVAGQSASLTQAASSTLTDDEEFLKSLGAL